MGGLLTHCYKKNVKNVQLLLLEYRQQTQLAASDPALTNSEVETRDNNEKGDKLRLEMSWVETTYHAPL